MSHVIEVAFAGDAKAVVAQVRAATERHGGVFSGDHVAGTFAGNGIEGHYRFGDKVVVVTIEKKPDFAPWPMVEMAIRGFFESKPAEVVVATDVNKRRERADAIIRKHVLLSSGAGLIPIPLADVAAVTAVQVNMLQDLTKLYAAEASESTLANFVAALTGGMIARLGASFVKAIPGVGTLLGGASMSILSGASTYAVGKVAKDRLESSGNLANVDMTKAKRDYSKAYESGKEYVTELNEDDKNKD